MPDHRQRRPIDDPHGLLDKLEGNLRKEERAAKRRGGVPEGLEVRRDAVTADEIREAFEKRYFDKFPRLMGAMPELGRELALGYARAFIMEGEPESAREYILASGISVNWAEERDVIRTGYGSIASRLIRFIGRSSDVDRDMLSRFKELRELTGVDIEEELHRRIIDAIINSSRLVNRVVTSISMYISAVEEAAPHDLIQSKVYPAIIEANKGDGEKLELANRLLEITGVEPTREQQLRLYGMLMTLNGEGFKRASYFKGGRNTSEYTALIGKPPSNAERKLVLAPGLFEELEAIGDRLAASGLASYVADRGSAAVKKRQYAIVEQHLREGGLTVEMLTSIMLRRAAEQVLSPDPLATTDITKSTLHFHYSSIIYAALWCKGIT
jgi:hypothetical protein